MPKYCPPFTPMIEVLPNNAESGPLVVEHFEMTERQVEIQRLRMISEFGQEEQLHDLEPGAYVSLRERDYEDTTNRASTLWMTDTPMERRTCLWLPDNARGDVLIAGLGIGMVLLPLLRNSWVNSITVIERDPRIKALMVPHITDWMATEPKSWDKSLRVEVADANTWWPVGSQGFDVIWLDIWPNISPSHLDEMHFLKERYSGLLTNKGSMGIWSYEQANRMQRAEQGDEEAIQSFLPARDRIFLETGIDPVTGMTKEQMDEIKKIQEDYMEKLKTKGYEDLGGGILRGPKERT